MASTRKVRVAIIGVGNCASSLVQGVHYYRDAKPEDFVPGLMHVNRGGYHIHDIEFSAAFDIDQNKVDKNISEAIYAAPNNTYRFADVPPINTKVYRGMTHDGLGKYLSRVITKAPGQTDDIVKILKDTGTDVVINYLPVGSETATKWYVEQILQAGVGLVNCIPVFIARETYWQDRFKEANLPMIGDDIKSQVGATIVHRVLAHLFREHGVKLEGPNAYLMKSPPVQYADDVAHEMTEAFIREVSVVPTPQEVTPSSDGHSRLQNTVPFIPEKD